MSSEISCANCNAPIVEATDVPEKAPCAVCGSTLRNYLMSLHDGIAFSEAQTTRAYRAGMSKKKGLFWEAFGGVDFSHRLQRLVQKPRLIDKENDRYRERVVDPLTGDVLRDVDERLSEHFGHGSAKPQKPD